MPRTLAAHAYGPLSRAGVTVLRGGAGALLVLMALLLIRGIVDGHEPPPLSLVITVGLYCGVPALLGAIWKWQLKARVVVSETHLVVEQKRGRVEVPLASIAGVDAWRVPIPAQGFLLRLGSGTALPEQLVFEDPLGGLDALAVGIPSAAALRERRSVIFSAARVRHHRRYAAALVLRYGLFPLLPALAVFRAHQMIAFGGPFGEWHALGAAAYLRTFGTYWGMAFAYLLLYAALWRALAELVSILAVLLAPRFAGGVRLGAELLDRVAYYAGIPALLLLRFLQ